jgi:hypothetical protein
MVVKLALNKELPSSSVEAIGAGTTVDDCVRQEVVVRTASAEVDVHGHAESIETVSVTVVDVVHPIVTANCRCLLQVGFP